MFSVIVVKIRKYIVVKKTHGVNIVGVADH